MLLVTEKYFSEILWSALCEGSDVMGLCYHIIYDTMNKPKSKANKQVEIIRHKLSYSLHWKRYHLLQTTPPQEFS